MMTQQGLSKVSPDVVVEPTEELLAQTGPQLGHVGRMGPVTECPQLLKDRKHLPLLHQAKLNKRLENIDDIGELLRRPSLGFQNRAQLGKLLISQAFIFGIQEAV